MITNSQLGYLNKTSEDQILFQPKKKSNYVSAKRVSNDVGSCRRETVQV